MFSFLMTIEMTVPKIAVLTLTVFYCHRGAYLRGCSAFW